MKQLFKIERPPDKVALSLLFCFCFVVGKLCPYLNIDVGDLIEYHKPEKEDE